MQVKLNSNLEAKTIDELKQSRQSICLEFAYELCKEARQLLRKADSQVISSLEEKLSKFINETRHPDIPGVKCADCVGSQPHACAFAIYFNDPHIFDRQMKNTFLSWKQMMLKEARHLQNFAKTLLCEVLATRTNHEDAALKAKVKAKEQSGTCVLFISLTQGAAPPHAILSL